MQTAGYRETAASGDPYKYIRSGNYARILAQVVLVCGEDGRSRSRRRRRNLTHSVSVAATRGLHDYRMFVSALVTQP